MVNEDGTLTGSRPSTGPEIVGTRKTVDSGTRREWLTRCTLRMSGRDSESNGDPLSPY